MKFPGAFKIIPATALFAGVLGAVPARATPVLQQAKTVFVIAMENHNFTQPTPTSSPQQIYANPAAPYLNSLITPGQFQRRAGFLRHDILQCWRRRASVRAELYLGGRRHGLRHSHGQRSDACQRQMFSTPRHLSRQLTAAGIPWNNYQEDVQLAPVRPTAPPARTAPSIPTTAPTQYNYAVKHNPLAFFADTQIKNVYPLTNFLHGPDEQQRSAVTTGSRRTNTMTLHNRLNGGFTYNGVPLHRRPGRHRPGRQLPVHRLPQIMASKAYRDNGVIIIWWDETESGDDTNRTIPEIIISPLAKGNAYASTRGGEPFLGPQDDGRNFRTGLPQPTPFPPARPTLPAGYNNVATVNDLSDLFRGGGPWRPAVGTTLTNGGSAAAFGTVKVGASVTNMFTLTNTGLATLTLSNLVVSGAKAGDYRRRHRLARPGGGGGSTTFNLVFSPTAGAARVRHAADHEQRCEQPVHPGAHRHGRRSASDCQPARQPNK